MRWLLLVVVGLLSTALCVALAVYAGFLFYDWAGGDFGGYGAAAHSPSGWALPAWLALTAVLVAMDIIVIRRAHGHLGGHARGARAGA